MLRKNCGKEISILIGWTRSCVLFVQAAAAWTCTNKMFWSSLIFARRLWKLLLRPLFLLSERCDDWSLCCWPQFWMAFRNFKTPFKSFQILLKDIYVKNWQYLKIVLLWFWRDLLNFNQKDILLFKSQFRQKAECTILTRKQWFWPGIALSSSVEPSETEGRRGEWAPIFLLVGKLVEISDINLRYWDIRAELVPIFILELLSVLWSLKRATTWPITAKSFIHICDWSDFSPLYLTACIW